MRFESVVGRLLLVFTLALSFTVRGAAASTCVWKVTGPNGGTLYLGGSIHALRPIDYPLPPAYNRAFDASSRLAFEEDPKIGATAFKDLIKAGQYPKGDSLKNHVDPRTYDYVRRFFALLNIPEEKFRTFRPWLIDVILTAPPLQYYQLGVERFLMKRAMANSKPISGLESPKEHNQVFVGLSDRESEALLLILFINAGHKSEGAMNIVGAWRNGDVDTIARLDREFFRDLPAMFEREVSARNQNWIPKIESYLRSGQTYFVVVGAGHMGGPDGLLSLLRTRGYKIEQF
jgi:uncharacterized protein YbaP (TraB family)